jgi:hypothetical protein
MKKMLVRLALVLAVLGAVLLPAAPAQAHGSCSRSATPIQESLQDLTTTAKVTCSDVHYEIDVIAIFQVKDPNSNAWYNLGSNYVNFCSGGRTSCSVNVGPTGCDSVPGFPRTRTYRVKVTSQAKRTSGSAYTHQTTSYVQKTKIYC